MAQVPQHKIDEAAKRGIVPGAVVRSPSSKAVFTVPNSGQWWMSDDDMLSGPCDNGNRHLFESEDGWATVLTPAPVEEEGLKEGDACECGPTMRAAIIELAKELGICENHGGIEMCDTLGVWNCHASGKVYMVGNFDGLTKLTPAVFISKMLIEAKKPRPIEIGDHVVKFNTGSITVGCTTIDNATVKAIAAKLIDP